MICLHRRKGPPFWVNPDLIVFVEEITAADRAVDTTLVMADGNRRQVMETGGEVAAAIIRYRAAVVAASETLSESFNQALQEDAR